MNAAQRETVLTKQIQEWPRCIAAGKAGNPFATLCLHCYGRHPPPYAELCPYEPPGRDRKSEKIDWRLPSPPAPKETGR